MWDSILEFLKGASSAEEKVDVPVSPKPTNENPSPETTNPISAPIAAATAAVNSPAEPEPEKKGFWRTFIAGKADNGWAEYQALQAKLYPEDAKKREAIKDRAARLQELQLKQSEMNLKRSEFAHEQAKINAPIETARREQDVANSKQYGANLVQQYEQSKKTLPLRLANLSAQSKINDLRAEQAQEKIWDANEAKAQTVYIDNFKNKVGYNQWTQHGQAIFDNSQAVKAFGKLSYMMQIANRDPKQFNYLLSELRPYGWEAGRDDKGELTLTNQNLDGVKYHFVANKEGLQKFAGDIQAKMKNDLMAARIAGMDAVSPGQATAKVVISNPVVKSICGDEGTAYGYYSDFYNRKIVNPKTGEVKDMFSPEQKTYHVLNLLVGSALEDGRFSDTEMANLIPQVGNMIKYLGGELKLGQGVDDTTVTWGRDQGYAQTYSIKDFLNVVLRDKDVITPSFGGYLQQIAAKKRVSGAGSGGIAGVDGGNTQETEHKEKRISEADSMYGSLFKNADDKKQNHIISVMDKFDAELKKKLKDNNVPTYDKLGLDDLRQLDNFWKNEMDDEKFYSPVQDKIFLIERDDLYAQKAPLIQKLREAEKKRPEWGKNEKLAKFFYNDAAKGIEIENPQELGLRKKIDEINDKIKMRERKLKERGVKFKEYK